jgi:hypothetical protein
MNSLVVLLNYLKRTSGSLSEFKSKAISLRKMKKLTWFLEDLLTFSEMLEKMKMYPQKLIKFWKSI